VTHDGPRTIVKCEHGEFIIENGRIIEATSGGQKTEFLSPEQAKQRQEERAKEAERQMQFSASEAAKPIVEALTSGQVPAELLKKAFNAAMNNSWKTGHDAEHLVKAINELLAVTQPSMSVALGEVSQKGDSRRVYLINSATGDRLFFDIPLFRKLIDAGLDNPILPPADRRK
jgi:hypothetical protein